MQGEAAHLTNLATLDSPPPAQLSFTIYFTLKHGSGGQHERRDRYLLSSTHLDKPCPQPFTRPKWNRSAEVRSLYDSNQIFFFSIPAFLDFSVDIAVRGLLFF